MCEADQHVKALALSLNDFVPLIAERYGIDISAKPGLFLACLMILDRIASGVERSVAKRKLDSVVCATSENL
jgi:hypothetical protein